MPRLSSRYGPPPTEVASRIRCERERLGISQAKMAERLGVNRGSVQALECTANPQLSTLIALVGLGFNLHRIAPELFSTRPQPDDLTSNV